MARAAAGGPAARDAAATTRCRRKGPGTPAGNFVVSRVLATIMPPGGTPAGRAGSCGIEIPGKEQILSLAEVQVFDGTDNLARAAKRGRAAPPSTARPSWRSTATPTAATQEAKSTTHTETSDDPWWEVDLKSSSRSTASSLWNRTDNGLHTRLGGFRVVVLDEKRAAGLDRRRSRSRPIPAPSSP